MDGTVRIWDTTKGTERRILRGHDKAITSIAFSCDGHILASASTDTTVRLWDSISGNERGVLEGHDGPVLSVAFAPDGQTLASGSRDGTIRLWDAATGEHLATLVPRPEGWAAFTPDGRYKLGGDIAGSFWHVIGLCRFEPGELDPYLPHLRVPDDQPFIVRPTAG